MANKFRNKTEHNLTVTFADGSATEVAPNGVIEVEDDDVEELAGGFAPVQSRKKADDDKSDDKTKDDAESKKSDDKADSKSDDKADDKPKAEADDKPAESKSNSSSGS